LGVTLISLAGGGGAGLGANPFFWLIAAFGVEEDEDTPGAGSSTLFITGGADAVGGIDVVTQESTSFSITAFTLGTTT